MKENHTIIHHNSAVVSWSIAPSSSLNDKQKSLAIYSKNIKQSGLRWRQVGTKLAPKIHQKMGYPIGLGGQKRGTPSASGAKLSKQKSVEKSNAT